MTSVNLHPPLLLVDGEKLPAPPQELTDRQRTVYKLKCAGHSLRDIARALACNHTTVRDEFFKAVAYLRRFEATDLIVQRDMALERLDIATAAIMPKVRAGNLSAISQLCFLEKRRAEMLGLDSAKRIEMTANGTGAGDPRMSDIRDRYTPEEAAQKAAEMSRSLVMLTTEITQRAKRRRDAMRRGEADEMKEGA